MEAIRQQWRNRLMMMMMMMMMMVMMMMMMMMMMIMMMMMMIMMMMMMMMWMVMIESFICFHHKFLQALNMRKAFFIFNEQLIKSSMTIFP